MMVSGSAGKRVFHFALLTLSVAVGVSCSESQEARRKPLPAAISDSQDTVADAATGLTSAESPGSGVLESAPVVIALVTRSALERGMSGRVYTAVTRGIREAQLDAKRPGRIIAVNVALGERVEAGQTLISLDSTLERLAVDAASARKESAEAGKKKAERDWERAQGLFAESGISESQLESTRLAYQMTKAAFGAAVAELGVSERQLSETRIVAPFDGEVSSLPYDVGETPPPGALISEVTDRRRLIVDIFFSEEDIQTIAVGMTASVGVYGDTASSRPGVLRALSPKANDFTKLFKGEVVIENQDLRLRAGATCRVTFPLEELSHPVAPLGAIIESKNQDGWPRVAVVTEDTLNESGAIVLRATLRRVTLGKRISSGVSILSGLDFGERIVVKGAQTLRDNQPLRAIEEAPLDSLLH